MKRIYSKAIILLLIIVTINSIIYYNQIDVVVEISATHDSLIFVLDKNVSLYNGCLKRIVNVTINPILITKYENLKKLTLALCSLFSIQTFLDFIFNNTFINNHLSKLNNCYIPLKGFNNYHLSIKNIKNTNIIIQPNKIATDILKFDLPSSISEKQLNKIQFFLIDDVTKKNLDLYTNNFLSNTKYLYNEVWEQFIKNSMRLTEVTKQIDERKEIQSRLQVQMNFEQVKINKIKKKYGYDCDDYLNTMVPIKPKYACEYKNRLNFATAMCIASVGGSELCGKFASKIGQHRERRVYNFLSGPTCGALVNDLVMKEKHSIDDIIGNAITGAYDDIGNYLIDSDYNLTGQFLKGIALKRKIDSFFNCINKAQDKCYSAYKSWNDKITEVKKKFAPISSACKQLSFKNNLLKTNKKYLSSLEERKKDISDVLNRLKEDEKIIYSINTI